MCCSEIEELKTNKCELGTYVNIDFGNWSEIPHYITRKVSKICSNTSKYAYLSGFTFVITKFLPKLEQIPDILFSW